MRERGDFGTHITIKEVGESNANGIGSIIDGNVCGPETNKFVGMDGTHINLLEANKSSTKESGPSILGIPSLPINGSTMEEPGPGNFLEDGQARSNQFIFSSLSEPSFDSNVDGLDLNLRNSFKPGRKKKTWEDILGLNFFYDKSLFGGRRRKKTKQVVFRSAVAAASLSVSSEGTRRNKLLINDAQAIRAMDKIVGGEAVGSEDDAMAKDKRSKRRRDDFLDHGSFGNGIGECQGGAASYHSESINTADIERRNLSIRNALETVAPSTSKKLQEGVNCESRIRKSRLIKEARETMKQTAKLGVKYHGRESFNIKKFLEAQGVVITEQEIAELEVVEEDVSNSVEF